MELAILSGCEISLSILYPNPKSSKTELFRFETQPTTKILETWNQSKQAPEILTTSDVKN